VRPELPHERPDTPPSSTVQATRTNLMGCTRPGGSGAGAPHSHAQVEAPCSALVDNTVAQRLCPRNVEAPCSALVDKQLRAP
jgi:hypothetical protein